jgi:ATP-dependent Lon protease
MQLSNYATFPTDIPIIAEDELFLYPFMISPLFLSDEKNIQAATNAIENNSLILVCPSKDDQEESGNPFDQLYPAGVIGSVMRKVALPDGRVKVLFQGLAKGKILEQRSHDPLIAHVGVLQSDDLDSAKMEALLEVVREKVRTLANVSSVFPPDLLRTIEENKEYQRIADLILSSLKVPKETAFKLFVEENPEQRFLELIKVLTQEIEGNKLQKEIRSKVHTKIDKVNKDYFLKEQLKQIQSELGVDNQREEEIEEYRKKLEKIKPFLEEEAFKEISKQIDRFARLHPDSADSGTIQTYLEWVLEVPYGEMADDELSISTVEKQLDEDHFSLEKAKGRIVEYFAVKELMQQRNIEEKADQGAILCFVGPPGVGKTSLANSIAEALQRPLIRIALGGLEDVNELRGHRRTYIGAMPGRIVQGLIEAKKMNPVVVLDEIDKLARSYRGDPTSVMLEILDPEQNSKFRDYYLNYNIDLSKIVFVATANDLSTIPAPLRDRMEFIQVSSYTPQEKYEIAKRYLVPQEIKKHGLEMSEVSISKGALQEIIHSYTREAGVRNLRRRIADIARKSAKKILENAKTKKVSVTVKNLDDFLEKSVFEIEKVPKDPIVGVVNGLAWTAVGGDVLKIEVIKIKGKGQFKVTGSLGDVMKESSQIAASVVKTLIDTKQVKIKDKLIPKTTDEEEKGTKVPASDVYNRYDLHIHVPDGATPKDGPSAGITMTTAIASIFSERKVRQDVAMTGEISLQGKVMPIGGLKEKLIAAHKAGINIALIPQKNYERDLKDIPDEVKNSMEIVAVKTIDEVLKIALV